MTPSQSKMANAIRALAMDSVQQANSGHPGAPLGMADMAVALWGHHLKHNPQNPHWLNRDRFVLSNGHASMLLYALLHLTGYDLSMDDLKGFRQLHSKTPGHPEVGITPGVETTTGPLGQGLSNAVGMALAEKLLAHEFNRPGFKVIDHHTFTFLGDGCLMEGISHEVCSLAGAWKLNKLIALYDDNGISIDGAVKPWFVDNTPERFKAYGWHVLGPIDGHDANAVAEALSLAKAHLESPTLIICKTTIGQGSPNRANTSKAHGEPFGEQEIELTRQALGWPHPPFEIPADIYKDWDAKQKGAELESAWHTLFEDYQKSYRDLATQLTRRMNAGLPGSFEGQVKGLIDQFEKEAPSVASRKASQMVLEKLTASLGELLGGSADLTGSNLTQTSSTGAFRITPSGLIASVGEEQRPNHINFGVREFGMAGIMNGLALHGGYIPYGGTFLTFSDYSRNAIRMAALMKLRVIHVFTHDSIGLGEDGPTHQSIEHASSLRLIPQLNVWRPCDTTETAVAWGHAIRTQDRPSALLLSRQNLNHAPKRDASQIIKGGYVVSDAQDAGLDRPAQAVIIATGSEVSLALKAQALLAKEGVATRVVSMPCTQVFDAQADEYRQEVLPKHTPLIAVEMGARDFWWKYKVCAVVGIDQFGESAPAADLFKHFGFTPEHVAQTVKAAIKDSNP
ncbi:MAG: transketolase [Burkholderiaceae bacterium]